MKSCSRNQCFSITDSTYIRAWSYHSCRYPIPSYQYNSVSNSPPHKSFLLVTLISQSTDHITLCIFFSLYPYFTQHATSMSNPTSIKHSHLMPGSSSFLVLTNFKISSEVNENKFNWFIIGHFLITSVLIHELNTLWIDFP